MIVSALFYPVCYFVWLSASSDHLERAITVASLRSQTRFLFRLDELDFLGALIRRSRLRAVVCHDPEDEEGCSTSRVDDRCFTLRLTSFDEDPRGP